MIGLFTTHSFTNFNHRAIKWYPFNPSIHRIFHVPLMIKILRERAPTITIGMLSEEAGESGGLWSF